MAECIDTEARELAHKAQRFAGEVAAVVWGDHERRDNGIRSRVNRHDERIEAVEGDIRSLRGDLRHYLDAEREETCHGLAALAEHEAKEQETHDEETQVAVAKIQAASARAGASWQGIAMIVGQILTLIGIIIVGLK